MKKILFAILILIMLNFIPIKFAKNKEIISDNDDEYLCSFTQSTSENLYAASEDNLWLKNDIFFDAVVGHYPLSLLNKDFTTDYLEPSGNKYFLKGNIDTKDSITTFNISSWNIKYPICRKSVRLFFTPRAYLTVYDFDWYAILKDLIGRKTNAK